MLTGEYKKMRPEDDPNNLSDDAKLLLGMPINNKPKEEANVLPVPSYHVEIDNFDNRVGRLQSNLANDLTAQWLKKTSGPKLDDFKIDLGAINIGK